MSLLTDASAEKAAEEVDVHPLPKNADDAALENTEKVTPLEEAAAENVDIHSPLEKATSLVKAAIERGTTLEAAHETPSQSESDSEFESSAEKVTAHEKVEIHPPLEKATSLVKAAIERASTLEAADESPKADSERLVFYDYECQSESDSEYESSAEKVTALETSTEKAAAVVVATANIESIPELSSSGDLLRTSESSAFQSFRDLLSRQPSGNQKLSRNTAEKAEVPENATVPEKPRAVIGVLILSTILLLALAFGMLFAVDTPNSGTTTVTTCNVTPSALGSSANGDAFLSDAQLASWSI